jgi:hypothetical protein
MKDEKRQLRKLKREIKKAGNKQRRRYLKDVEADPSGFEFGRNRSDVLNEPERNSRDS